MTGIFFLNRTFWFPSGHGMTTNGKIALFFLFFKSPINFQTIEIRKKSFNGTFFSSKQIKLRTGHFFFPNISGILLITRKYNVKKMTLK